MQEWKGVIHIGICNMDHSSDANIEIELRGWIETDFEITGTTLAADNVRAHNTFDQPDVVKPKDFRNYERNGSLLQVRTAPASVTVPSIQRVN